MREVTNASAFQRNHQGMKHSANNHKMRVQLHMNSVCISNNVRPQSEWSHWFMFVVSNQKLTLEKLRFRNVFSFFFARFLPMFKVFSPLFFIWWIPPTLQTFLRNQSKEDPHKNLQNSCLIEELAWRIQKSITKQNQTNQTNTHTKNAKFSSANILWQPFCPTFEHLCASVKKFQQKNTSVTIFPQRVPLTRLHAKQNKYA